MSELSRTPVIKRDYPPPRIIICAVHGDWIEWKHQRDARKGDCPFGECDCRPVVYRYAR